MILYLLRCKLLEPGVGGAVVSAVLAGFSAAGAVVAAHLLPVVLRSCLPFSPSVFLASLAHVEQRSYEDIPLLVSSIPDH